MEIKKTWQRVDNAFFLRDISTNVDMLEKGVYVLEVVPQTGELFLNQVSPKFEFDFKIYGLEESFIAKVLKTFKNTKSNLGMLLNGVKGTGKTITAEIIANELKLPTILIHHPFRGSNSFLNSINQDVTILIDEYEKVYNSQVGDGRYTDDEQIVKNSDSSLLSLMDGTFKTKWRKVFILTTNRVWVNENMLNRPGRIRYLKQFSDLTHAQIMEIIDDCLVETQFKDDIIAFIKPLKIITVDIVKSIISEVNIFKEPPAECCKEFNLEFKSDEYKIYKVGEGKLKDRLIVNGAPAKNVDSFLSYVKTNWKNAILQSGGYYLQSSKKPDLEKGIFTVVDHNANFRKEFKIKIEKAERVHYSFYSMND